MEHLTQAARDELSRKRFYTIPLELVYKAQQYLVRLATRVLKSYDGSSRRRKNVSMKRRVFKIAIERVGVVGYEEIWTDDVVLWYVQRRAE